MQVDRKETLLPPSMSLIRLPLVIVESPYAGEIEYNIAYAKRAVHDCMMRGEAPIASHLLFTQPGILDDNKPTERLLGIECGLAWYQAKVLVAVYVDLGISPGMGKALEYADLTRTPIEYRTIGRNPE